MLIKGLSAQLRISYDNSADMDDTRSKEYAYNNVTQLFNESGNIYDYLYTRYGNDTELVFNNGVLATQFMRTSIWAKLNYIRDFNAHHVNAKVIFFITLNLEYFLYCIRMNLYANVIFCFINKTHCN